MIATLGSNLYINQNKTYHPINYSQNKDMGVIAFTNQSDTVTLNTDDKQIQDRKKSNNLKFVLGFLFLLGAAICIFARGGSSRNLAEEGIVGNYVGKNNIRSADDDLNELAVATMLLL